MSKFVWMGIVLQLAMVTAGHFVEAVLMLSGPLGVGIPFVLGIWYGATVPRTYGETSKGGFVIGIVGAFIGVLAAILMGDAVWTLMTFAPLSSGVTGVMGGALGTAVSGRAKAA